MKNIILFGSSGAIGNALTQKISAHYKESSVYAVSRDHRTTFNSNVILCQASYSSEASIASLASKMQDKMFDMIIVATGLLHNRKHVPEKSIKELSSEKFHSLFAANTVFPALVAKHFSPLLNKSKKSIFAALSARVGSISDNSLGGWYSYRISKAGLNMLIKNLAIEFSRRFTKQSIFVGLHPGTVDSALSRPFQNSVPSEKIFTPEYSASRLMNVLQQLTPADTGKVFSWDSGEILP